MAILVFIDIILELFYPSLGISDIFNSLILLLLVLSECSLDLSYIVFVALFSQILNYCQAFMSKKVIHLLI